MSPSIGLQALTVQVPDRILTNDHWRENQPRLVAEAEERIWMWKKPTDWKEGSEAFNREMAPFLSDPFRGTDHRRFLDPGGTALSLEAGAARSALDAAGVEPEEVDLLICTSFLPDANGIGGATFLARELGLRGAAWNLESACSSALLGFQTACAQVAAGLHRRALVVTSCCYSRVTVESDPISWGIGDAATAMVVGPVASGEGFLGGHSEHSAATCGAVRYDLEVGDGGEPYFRLRTGKSASRLLRETSEGYLRRCTGEALRKAGVTLDDVDFCVFNTPLAWYASFCARALGVDRRRTLSVYPLYANVGPALLGLNLFHAGHWKLRPGDLVLLYTVGSVSSCAAAVVRWGDVALGPLPNGFSQELLERHESEAIERSEAITAAA